jgi:hypothetical protein
MVNLVISYHRLLLMMLNHNILLLLLRDDSLTSVNLDIVMSVLNTLVLVVHIDRMDLVIITLPCPSELDVHLVCVQPNLSMIVASYLSSSI